MRGDRLMHSGRLRHVPLLACHGTKFNSCVLQYNMLNSCHRSTNVASDISTVVLFENDVFIIYIICHSISFDAPPFYIAYYPRYTAAI